VRLVWMTRESELPTGGCSGSAWPCLLGRAVSNNRAPLRDTLLILLRSESREWTTSAGSPDVWCVCVCVCVRRRQLHQPNSRSVQRVSLGGSTAGHQTRVFMRLPLCHDVKTISCACVYRIGSETRESVTLLAVDIITRARRDARSHSPLSCLTSLSSPCSLASVAVGRYRDNPNKEVPVKPALAAEADGKLASSL
jgi:hypothetical protein